MTRSPLRLVFDQGDDTRTAALELPPTGSEGLHIHLHVGPSERLRPSPAAVAPADADTKGKGRRRPLLLGVAGIVIAVVAFDLGARSGEGHARALAASQASVTGLPSLASALPSPATASTSSSELPASVRQQLAQQPTVTAAPGVPAAAGAPDPFGLQH
ncbi:MAG: hypothetical protein QOG73_2682 [Acetobacteraceae bacterium]|jgi:hypothetical protein|nr:hypothetical protein [Acetobacteraceae bacterium]